MFYFIHQQVGEYSEQVNLKFLSWIGNECFNGNFKVIITDNTIQKNITNQNYIKLSSGNEYREFSGWITGLEYLKLNTSSKEISGIVLSNQTMLSNRAFDIPMRNAIRAGIFMAQEFETPVMFGDLDLIRSQGPYFYKSIDSYYISTYFIFLNKSALDFINVLNPDDNLYKLFNKTPNCSSVLLGEYKDIEYYKVIEGWLYKNHGGPKWYLHEKLSLENYNYFSKKLFSILTEHGISQRFVNRGGRLIGYKQFINRTIIEEIIFFMKRVKYSLGWRIKKYKKFGFF
ncbi:hypothetical protein VC159_09265 [Polynucleobacter sp. JS-JIR-II-c23]|jgi:hypothetical protein|uniref:hypothetical protein n=1 Tax=Polynucleobacter sp. JS-JIR-II-c23 TaxID=1758393 RepID=UPI002B237CEF|nr:hypothetical protein [Polynucleobacter sp. JS-JIR-II-c23]MEA9604638.1 hypothetical protein [Polynucleobacter sp. JS-JIR-II-c23]